jgi:hypothetical protein
LAACLLTVLCVPPASAGVEPSPFIGAVRAEIDQIRIVVGQDDAILLSLSAIEARLAELAEAPELRFGVDPELAERGARVVGHVATILRTRASSLTRDQSSQLVTVMGRMVSILFDPQPEPPGYVAQGFGVLEGVSSWVMFDPQPEPPGREGVLLAQGVRLMVSLSSIMFDPQPEPPGYVTLGVDVLYRISSIYFDPQPEPPGFASILQLQSIYVMSQVAGVIEQARIAGLQRGTIPGLNALHALSGHLWDAMARGDSNSAAAQVGAMVEIAAGYSR